jgi:hypothetical protein
MARYLLVAGFFRAGKTPRAQYLYAEISNLTRSKNQCLFRASTGK